MTQGRKEPQRELAQSVYISELRIQNFGEISDETVYFDQGVNELLDLTDGGTRGKLVLKAIEIMLWAAQGEIEPRAFGNEELLASWNETASYITGTFEKRRIYNTVDRSDYIRGTITAAMGGEAGKKVTFSWQERPDNLKIPDFFEKYGWHSGSITYLSHEMLEKGHLLPMKFFSGQLDKVDFIKKIRKNVDFIKSRKPALIEAIERIVCNERLLDLAKIRAKTLTTDQVRATDPSRDFHLTLKKLRDSAEKLQLELVEEEAAWRHLEDTERQRLDGGKDKITKLAEQAASLSIDSDPPDASRLTLESTLEGLRMELTEKTGALKSITTREENFSNRIQRHDVLRKEMEKNLSAMLQKKALLAKLEKDKQQDTSRLKVVKDQSVPLGTSKHFSQNVQSKIDFLEVREQSVSTDSTATSDEIKMLEERRDAIALEKLQIEERLKAREKRVRELFGDELMAKRAADEAQDDCKRGNGDDGLATEVTSFLSRDCVQVLIMMNSIVRPKMGSNEGFYGAVIDHLDVNEEQRCLLRPIQSFLATFLVRDLEVAAIVREHIRREMFERTVDLISFEDFNRPQEPHSVPAGTKPLSSYLRIEKTRPHALSSVELESKLLEIIEWELRDYVVIEGDPAESSDAASKFLEDPEWESFTFIAEDGTCFSSDARSAPASHEDVLDVYDIMRRYWESKNLELTSRMEDFQKQKQMRTEAQNDLLSTLGETRTKLQEMDQLQEELHWHRSAQQRLDTELTMIKMDLDRLRGQKVAIESAQSTDESAFAKKLEDTLTCADDAIEQLRSEIRSIDASSSKLILEMAENLIALASRDEKYEKILVLKNEINVLQEQVQEADEYLKKYASVESDGATTTTPAVHEDAPCKVESFGGQRIMLLREKLESLRKKIVEFEAEGVSAGFGPNVGCAQKLREATTDKSIPSVSEKLRQRLLNFLNKTSQVKNFSRPPQDLLDQILSLSNVERYLPCLEQDTLNEIFSHFDQLVKQLKVGKGIKIIEEQKVRLGRIAFRERDLNDTTPLGQNESYIEMTFDPAPKDRKARQEVERKRKDDFLVSALTVRTRLHEPRILLVDEEEVSMSSLSESLRQKFFSEFTRSCQLFILSHDPSDERLYLVDKQLKL